MTSELQKKAARAVGLANRKHGMRSSPAYRSWIQMRTRCKNPNHHAYSEYGGRGIGVCPRWDSFENFLADMGERPEGKSLDRIDPNGNYEPGNCRWAAPNIQAQNKRTAKLATSDVEAIRSLLDRNESQQLIARMFGVSASMISKIKAGARW